MKTKEKISESKKKINYIFPIITGLFILIIILSYRHFFLNSLDLNYLQDLFDHSQWKISNSVRVISDNELYQIAGYKIVTGTPIFEINPEVPPLGKYIYGLSILLFGNAYYASVILFIITSVIFFHLSKTIFKNSKKAWYSLCLFVLSPIIFSQIGQTMLDLPQLLWFLLHILAIIKFSQAETSKFRWLWLVISAFGLSAFAATKIAAFVPVIILADIWWFYRKKTLISIIPFSVISGFFFLSFYSPFFMSGGTLIQWLKSIKWTFNFYLISKIKAHPLTSTLSIITPYYKEHSSNGAWHFVPEWNILWPITLIIPIWLILSLFLKKMNLTTEKWLIGIYSTGLTIAYIMLPSVPRYFILVIPLAIIFLTSFFYKIHIIRYLTILILIIFNTFYLRPQPKNITYFASADFENTNYQELYYHLAPTSVTREEFLSILKQFDYDLSLQGRKVSITSDYVYPWENSAPVTISITHQTPIGPIQFERKGKIVRIDNMWKLIWDWTFLHENFTQNSQIKATYYHQNINEKLSSSNQNFQFPYLFLNTQYIDDYEPIIKNLINITYDFSQVELENRIIVLGEGNKIIDVGFLNPDIYKDKGLLQSIDNKPEFTIAYLPKVALTQDKYQDIIKLKILNKESNKFPDAFGKVMGKIEIISPDNYHYLIKEKNN